MKQTTTATWQVILLASVLAAISNTCMAAIGSDGANKDISLEDSAKFSQYIQAQFDKRAQEDKEQADKSSTSCSNEKSEIDDSSSATSNSCTKENDTLSKTEVPDSDKRESLEDAIQKGTINTDANDSGVQASARTTFKSFPLNPVTALDLSNIEVGNLLGIFNSLIYKDQTSDSADNQLASGNHASDSYSQTLYNDITFELYTQIFDSIIAHGAIVQLENGAGTVELSAEIIDDGLRINLDADIRTGLYIVDRDGVPGLNYARAGAVDISSIGINISNLTTDIKARSSANVNIIEINAYTPDAITVDLSDTKIGVADAFADGSKIGAVTTVFSFGADSALTIGPGVSIATAITRPDGLQTPLLTINGVVGTIAMHDLALLDQGQSVFHIGTLKMDGLKLVNTRVFFDGPKIIIDMGTGITNASLAIERLSLGYGPNTASLGDFYASHIRLINSRITIEPH